MKDFTKYFEAFLKETLKGSLKFNGTFIILILEKNFDRLNF